MSYKEFVNKRQIQALGLRRTCFAEDLDSKFAHEDVSKSPNVHQLFKTEVSYVDPSESPSSYTEEGKIIRRVDSSALRGFCDIWASAQDISFWDIGLAGSILIHKPENRKIVYAPWALPDGKEVPACAGWHFYKHRGLMDIKGSVPGFSSFLSRFTHPEELVCVTLMGNKEGVDFTNLARRIAASFGDLMSTNYDDNKLFLYESQFSVQETVRRLEEALKARGIEIFAKFDHELNARGANLKLRPTTVVVFGSPKAGTLLMQNDQSIALELPLRIGIWEDEAGSTWLAFRRMDLLGADYGLQDHPLIPKMQALLEDLVKEASSAY